MLRSYHWTKSLGAHFPYDSPSLNFFFLLIENFETKQREESSNTFTLMVKVVHPDSKSTSVTSQMQVSEKTQLQCPGFNNLAKPLTTLD